MFWETFFAVVFGNSVIGIIFIIFAWIDEKRKLKRRKKDTQEKTAKYDGPEHLTRKTATEDSD